MSQISYLLNIILPNRSNLIFIKHIYTKWDKYPQLPNIYTPKELNLIFTKHIYKYISNGSSINIYLTYIHQMGQLSTST